MPAHRKYIELVDRVCPVCEAAYKAHPVRLRHGRETTCSRACSYKLRATEREVAKVTVNCAVCANPVTRLPDRTNRPKWAVTCSRTCKGKAQTLGIIEHKPKPYKRGAKHALWDGGTRHRKYGHRWKIHKRQARIRDKYTCQKCGVTETTLGRRMQVHHIIPFRDFTDSREANKLENLICYCSKCHAQVDADIRTERRKARHAADSIV